MGNEYRSILKATSIFGGTQLLQIGVGLVRTKLVAILIGSAGLGLSSLYLSSITMYCTIFGLGINISVVRDLSKAYDEGDMQRFSQVVKVFRRLLLVLSIAGTAAVILMSPQLSEWSFKTADHVSDFCALSLIVLLQLLSQGNSAVLVGMRRIKDLAASSLIKSVAALVIIVPFFYFWGLKGVVPGLVASTAIDYLVTWLYVRRIELPSYPITRSDMSTTGLPLVKLGAAMVIAQLLGSVSGYGINIVITRWGGLSDLGLYIAGIGMTAKAVELVFAAMSADYFPRLVTSLSDRERMNNTINRQSEILLYLCVPLLALMMVGAPLIISMLLTAEFQCMQHFIRVLCLGMIFKAASYALGYVVLAQGNKKIYLLLEGIYGNVMNLILAVGMYYFWGLTGLAWSFVVGYVLYLVVVSVVCRVRYHYRQDIDQLLRLFISIASLGALLALSYVLDSYSYYAAGGCIALVLVIYNLRILNRKTQLLSYVKTKLRK